MKTLLIILFTASIITLTAQEGFIQHYEEDNDINGHVLTKGDFNNDGKEDIVLDNGGVLQWVNMTNFDDYSLEDIGGIDGTAGIIITDMDGDTDIDILHASVFTNKIVLFINDGNGSFIEMVVAEDIDDVQGLTAMDIDSDGDMDILAGFRDRIDLFENDNNSAYSVSQFYTESVSGSIENLIPIDFDQDGSQDIIASSDRGVFLLRNNGSDIYNKQELISYGDAEEVYIEDFNGNGQYDILTRNAFSRDLKLFTNNGNSFSEETLAANPNSFKEEITVGKLNSDDLPEIITIRNYFDTFEGQIDWSKNTNGTFSENILTEEFSSYDGITLADLDGDGDLDIVCIAQSFIRDGFLVFENDIMVGTDEKPSAFTEAPKITIYPNPVVDVIHIESSIPWNGKPAIIYNMNGQLIKMYTNPNQNLGVNDIKRGNYYLKIQGFKGLGFIKN